MTGMSAVTQAYLAGFYKCAADRGLTDADVQELIRRYPAAREDVELGAATLRNPGKRFKMEDGKVRPQPDAGKVRRILQGLLGAIVGGTGGAVLGGGKGRPLATLAGGTAGALLGGYAGSRMVVTGPTHEQDLAADYVADARRYL